MSSATRGFTLIEMLVTLTMLAIAMGVGVPSLVEFQRNAELRAAVDALKAAIQMARSEAMKRNMHALVVPAADQQWGSGYLVLVDSDRSGTATKADIVVARHTDLPANLEVTGTETAAATAPFIRFDGSGYLRDGALGFAQVVVTIRRRDAAGRSNAHAYTRHVFIGQAGRLRSCTPASASDGDCDAAKH